MPLSAKIALETYLAKTCPGDSANGLCLRYWLETPTGKVLSFDKRQELDAMVGENRWGMVAGQVNIKAIKPKAVLENFTGHCHDQKCKGEMQPDGTVLSFKLLTPDGFKLLVTRDEATEITAKNGWEIQDNTHG